MLKTATGKIIIAVVLIGLAAAAALYYAVLRTPEAASEPIAPIPIDEPTQAPAISEDEPAATDVAPPDDPAPTTLLFEIVPEESLARFSLGEILRGEYNLVIGVTDQVAGQISIDLSDPSAAQVGAISINARTFATDNSNRDRAIKNQILDTNIYEFITFTPTSIAGLPSEAVVGETMEFEITGDLTIRDITHQVTFSVTVLAVSETRLEGSGSATITRADFNLTIPNVPSVASVDEDVIIEIEFVALAVE
ncbi:MAG: YceI family protein [Anaerolineae bacterium]|nr:YceI family protein [Anaerolineae bacterium]